MIFSVINVIFGLLFGLFLPGYLLMKIFYDKQKGVERFILIVALSLAVDVLIGLSLGGNHIMKDLTGGITVLNVWVYMIFVCLVLFVVFLVKKIVSVSKKR